MSGDDVEEKKRQISEWLDVYANSSEPPVRAAEDQLPALRALEEKNCSPIALLEQYPFLSVAVVSLEGTTLNPFITIVHHVVEYQVADNKDDEDSDGVESGFQGVITLGDADDLVLVRLPKRVFDVSGGAMPTPTRFDFYSVQDVDDVDDLPVSYLSTDIWNASSVAFVLPPSSVAALRGTDLTDTRQ
jgi:hypothetical protein